MVCPLRKAGHARISDLFRAAGVIAVIQAAALIIHAGGVSADEIRLMPGVAPIHSSNIHALGHFPLSDELKTGVSVAADAAPARGNLSRLPQDAGHSPRQAWSIGGGPLGNTALRPLPHSQDQIDIRNRIDVLASDDSGSAEGVMAHELRARIFVNEATDNDSFVKGRYGGGRSIWTSLAENSRDRRALVGSSVDRDVPTEEGRGGVFDLRVLDGSKVFSALGVSGWRRDLALDPLIPAYIAGNGFSAGLSYLPPVSLNAIPASFGNSPGLKPGQRVSLGLAYAPILEDCTLELCSNAATSALVKEGLVKGDANIDLSSVAEGISLQHGAGKAAGKAGRTLAGSAAHRDFASPGSVSNGLTASWSDVFETSLYLENILNVDEKPLRLGLGASFVSADRTNQPQSAAVIQSDEYESISVRLNLDYRGLSFGGSVRNTRGGIGAFSIPEQDYLAFETGVALNLGNLSVALGYGEGTNLSSDYFGLYRDSQSAQAGVSFVFDRGVTIGAAAQFVQPREGQLELDPETSVTFESAFKF